MSLVYITVYLIPRPPTVICISSPTHPSVESYKSTCVFTSKEDEERTKKTGLGVSS